MLKAIYKSHLFFKGHIIIFIYHLIKHVNTIKIFINKKNTKYISEDTNKTYQQFIYFYVEVRESQEKTPYGQNTKANVQDKRH